MARIAGVDLPNEKRIEAGLTYIYGIGWPTSRAILEKTGIDPSTRVKDLTEEEAGKIRKVIESVRGQKTKTNARTRKGPKKTVGRKKKG